MNINEASEIAKKIMANGMNLNNSDVICDAVCHWFIGEGESVSEKDFAFIAKMIAAQNGQVSITPADIKRYHEGIMEELGGVISWDE